MNPQASPQPGIGPKPLADLSPEDCKRYGEPGFRVFLGLADEWDLSVKERCILLGGIAPATYHKWKGGNIGAFTRDQIERLSLILGIYKGIELLFSNADGGRRWLKAANHDLPFGGRAPLGRMLLGSIDDLFSVRRYLDAWRGVK
jgi:hypothetical protein